LAFRGLITKKLMTIERYKIKAYLSKKIIDIDVVSNDKE